MITLTIFPWVMYLIFIGYHGKLLKESIDEIRQSRKELESLDQYDDSTIWQYGSEYQQSQDVTIYDPGRDYQPTLTVADRRTRLIDLIDEAQHTIRTRVIHLGILAVLMVLTAWGESVMWDKITM